MAEAQSPTVNDVISDVRNDLNAVNLDDYIPARYIHNKLLDNAKLFIKRDSDERKLQLYPSIWVTIDSFEMEESSLIGCSDISIPNCTRVMKSRLKLPDIYTTRYGYLMNISSIDFNTQFTQVTPREYALNKSRRYQNPKIKYFWIYNGYLIIPDSLVQTVTLRAIFTNKAHGLRIDSCSKDSCIRMLSQEFTAPPHLLKDIKAATVQELAGIKKRIVPDEFPNLDSNEKKSPVSK